MVLWADRCDATSTEPISRLSDRMLHIMFGRDIPKGTMGAKSQPAKQQTADCHDGSDNETHGCENNADPNERYTNEHLLPPLCVHEETANDHQESTVHATPIKLGRRCEITTRPSQF
jgi:hypothetical protein